MVSRQKYVAEAEAIFRGVAPDLIVSDAEEAAGYVAILLYDRHGQVEGMDWEEIALEAVEEYF